MLLFGEFLKGNTVFAKQGNYVSGSATNSFRLTNFFKYKLVLGVLLK